MFPGLNPITLRQSKAREVFILFKRTDKLTKRIKKEQEEKPIKSNKKEEMIDVTGRTDVGWYVWFILATPFIGMLLNNVII